MNASPVMKPPNNPTPCPPSNTMVATETGISIAKVRLEHVSVSRASDGDVVIQIGDTNSVASQKLNPSLAQHLAGLLSINASRNPHEEDLASAIREAYGYLWLINEDPGPNQITYEQASTLARQSLKSVLSVEHRKQAINEVLRGLGRAPL